MVFLLLALSELQFPTQYHGLIRKLERRSGSDRWSTMAITPA